MNESDIRTWLESKWGDALSQSVDATESCDIQARIESEWAQGMNVHHVKIESLAHHAFMLLGEQHRPKFLKEVGQELDSRSAPYADRKDWLDLLGAI